MELRNLTLLTLFAALVAGAAWSLKKGPIHHDAASLARQIVLRSDTLAAHPAAAAFFEELRREGISAESTSPALERLAQKHATALHRALSSDPDACGDPAQEASEPAPSLDAEGPGCDKSQTGDLLTGGSF